MNGKIAYSLTFVIEHFLKDVNV